jgi:hypothetical protein
MNRTGLLTPLSLILLPALYAETHYRFKYFFSYLRKSEPEIIADIPHRLDPGKVLPVLLVIKDADRYPVRIVRIAVSDDHHEIFSDETGLNVSEPYKEFIFPVPAERLTYGLHQISVNITYQCGRHIRTCVTDNHRGTSHAPLPVYISENPLPKIGNCYFGEPHSHTNHTSDQVEFGASLKANLVMAKALGLDFFAATDHSYDLDDYPGNYLRNDPGIKKWKSFCDEAADLNREDNDFVIIPGEEVSVRSSGGRNIHCLIYNHPDFIPGSGDGAEKWFHWNSEYSLPDALGSLSTGASAFAAHPFEEPPLLQRIFINRGAWTMEDCKNEHLHGLQIINGGADDGVPNDIAGWARLLLQGYRLTGLAGNDAHGNFARFRQISFPFFTMREHYYHLFGRWRTGVHLEDDTPFSLDSLLKAINTGKCFMSNGPALFFSTENDGSSLRCRIATSAEFGLISRVKIIRGIIGDDRETVVQEKHYEPHTGSDDWSLPVVLAERTAYYRCEVITEKNRMAFSNPVWFESV